MSCGDGFSAAKSAFPSWRRWNGLGYVNLSTAQCLLLLLLRVGVKLACGVSPSHLCQVLFSRLCWPRKLEMGHFPYFLYSGNDMISSWVFAEIQG